jgi:beta-lactamase regulating signal transducer with metallopeptidase domain
MDPLTGSLLWCIVQVTLVALLAWVLCALVGRFAGPGKAALPAVALAAIVVLTACAFIPWPNWWRYGPRWESATAALPAAPALLPREEVKPAESTALADGDWLSSEPEFSAALPHRSDDAIPNAVQEESLPGTAEPSMADRFWSWLPTLIATTLGCGALLGLLQLAGGLLSVRSYRRASQPLEDPELVELVDCLRAELSLTRSVELRESNHLATAATIGWTRPVVLLPPGWRDWTDDQRRAVLAHELAHVARGDYLACVLAQLSLAIHFYHPLIHWLAARLRLEQELAADATAALLSGGRKLYLQSLAELALHTTERPLGWPAHTFLPTQGTFLRRIEMLRDSELPRSAARSRLTMPGWVQRWAAVGLLVIGAAAIAGLRGGPAASANAQQPAGGEEVNKAGGRIDLTQVSNDAKMLVAIRPAEIAKVPEIREVLEKTAGDGPSPVKLLTMDGIEQITLIGLAGVEPDDWGRDALVVLQFNKATSFEDVAKTGAYPAEAKRVAAVAAAGSTDARQPAYGVVNDKTIVLGSAQIVGKYLGNRRKGQPAIAAAAWEKVRMGAIVAALDMELIRDQLRNRTPGGPDELLATLAPLWTDSEYVLSGVIVEGKTVHLRAIATCQDAELAGNVADTVTATTTLVRNMLRSVREKEQNIPEFARFAIETGEGLLKSAKVERTESLVVVQTKTDMPKAGGAAAGGLLNAVTGARAAAQRSVSQNNMKQIMLALHNWADTRGSRFPPPVMLGRDGKGKFPHSWRIEILPYIEQDALYREYKFDEPWDSDANKKVMEKMPGIFRHPQDDPKSTNAAYFVLTPEKLLEEKVAPNGGRSPPEGGFPTAFSAVNGMSFAQIFDGTSNTIAIVEAKRDIPWTKPEDILFDKEKDPPKLGGFFKDGYNVGICDGSVRFISHSIDPKTLHLLIMPGDGTPIPGF